jgi:hypothetical protein
VEIEGMGRGGYLQSIDALPSFYIAGFGAFLMIWGEIILDS